MRTPLSAIAGLYEDEAVWPFTTASASIIVTVVCSGKVAEIGSSSYVATETTFRLEETLRHHQSFQML